MASVFKRGRDKGRKGSVYYIAWTDEDGVRKTSKGFTDKEKSLALARHKEDEARMVREGLLDRSEMELRGHKDRPLNGHIDAFDAHLATQDITDRRRLEVIAKVRRIADVCSFLTVADITAPKVESALANLRTAEGLSKQTSNHYLRAMKQFLRWLVKTNRCERNPLADIKMLNVQTDRRHDRRALTADEFSRLVEAAEGGKAIEGIAGPDRAMMYVLSAWTGYRKGEIGSLTLRSFALESDPPTVTVQAVYSKRKRTDTQVLHEAVVSRLRSWLETKADLSPEALLFPVSGKVPTGIERKTSKMMQLDLAAARKTWIEEAETPQQKDEQEASDFLAYQSHDGRFADFHANRHTFITNLSRAGVSPKTAQTLARHSDIRLTMNVYSHTDLTEQIEAVRRLPGLAAATRNVRSDSAEAVDLHASNGEELAAPWQRLGDADGQSVSSNGKDDETEEAEIKSGDLAEVVSQTQVGTTCHSMSPNDESTPQWARTTNLRFRRSTRFTVLCEIFFALSPCLETNSSC